jgi:hypothetical protein
MHDCTTGAMIATIKNSDYLYQSLKEAHCKGSREGILDGCEENSVV